MSRKIMWLLKSLLASYIATMLMLMLLTLAVYKLDIGEKAVSAGIVSIYILSTMVGGVLIGKMAQMRRFIWGIGLGMLYFLLLLLITLGIYRNINSDMANMVTTWILCVGGGMIGGMIS